MVTEEQNSRRDEIIITTVTTMPSVFVSEIKLTPRHKLITVE